MNEFDDNLKEGKKWEQPAFEAFAKLNLPPKYKIIPLPDYDNQTKGIDGQIEYESIRLEAKTRANPKYKPDDILIEICSVYVDGPQSGWYYTIKADYLLYSWIDKTGLKLMEGYAIAINKNLLREWLDSYIMTNLKSCIWSKTDRIEREWWTCCIPVDITAFPNSTIWKLDYKE